MGGSGSSGGWTPPSSGLGGGSGKDPCDLRIKTELFGPIPDVVSGLRVGDRLSIQLIKQGESKSVAAITQDTGKVAGTIARVSQIGELVECLESFEYEASIVALSGSQVTVIIERVQN